MSKGAKSLKVSQKSVRVANEGAEAQGFSNIQDWVEYRKSSNVPDKQASAWTQRKKRFLLKDEVDFKPQSTAQLMKWQPWEGSAKFEARCGHTATVLANQTQALIFAEETRIIT